MEDSGKLARASVGEDRISNLPVSVICHILSFLRTPTVVATCILSKRWQFLWTEVTTLNFLLREGIGAAKVRKFVEFVNRVLLHIKSQRLQKFELRWWSGSKQFPEYVTIWTSFAISRRVRELVIDLDTSDLPEGTQLPGTLFTCATLAVLKLRTNFVLKVPSVVCLPKLEVLELSFLCYESEECINKLISCCPALHSLKIGREGDTMLGYRVSSLSLRSLETSVFNWVGSVVLSDLKIEIDAPNLERFVLQEVIKDCSVKSLTSVNHAEIDLNVFRHAVSDDDLVNGLHSDRCNSALKLVEAMNRAKYLYLTDAVIMALSYATTPLSVCFERLVELEVSVPCCHWSSLGVILGRSTKLQDLKLIKVPHPTYFNTHNLCWEDPKKVPGCLSSSLRKVSLFEFDGLEDEMEMIKYTLQHGEVLELLTFKPNGLNEINENLQLLQQISAFSRISRACQINFDLSDNPTVSDFEDDEGLKD